MAKNFASNLNRIFCIFVSIMCILLIFPLCYGCSGDNGLNTNVKNNDADYIKNNDADYKFNAVVQHIKNKGSYSNNGYSISVREGKYIFMLMYHHSTGVISLNCSYSEYSETVIFNLQIKDTKGKYTWTTLYDDYRMSGTLTASNVYLSLDYSNYPSSIESRFWLASDDLADICIKCFSGILYYDIGTVSIEDFGFSSKYSAKK